MGGATSSTSKTVIVSKSSRPDHDVDYLFGQVSIDKAFVDWSGNCGNLSAAVGPFAITNGLLDAARMPRDGNAIVRIWQSNIGKHHRRARAPRRTPACCTRPAISSSTRSDPFRPRIDPASSSPARPTRARATAVARCFPQATWLDELEVPGLGRLKATMINAGIPTIFVNADAIGYTGTELQDAINNDAQALAMFEDIRAHGALRMGLISRIEDAATRQHTPKVAFVASARQLRGIEWQAGRGQRHRRAGACALHGQAAPRDDGHGRRRHRYGRGNPRNAGQPCGGRWFAQRSALRPSIGHIAGRRGSAAAGRPVDGHQGHHEPQRAGADGKAVLRVPPPEQGTRSLFLALSCARSVKTENVPSFPLLMVPASSVSN